MEGSRLDVDVDVAGEMVVITWQERDVLLEELAFAEGTKSIRERFEAVGASQPVDTRRGVLPAETAASPS